MAAANPTESKGSSEFFPVLKETVNDWLQDNATRLSAALSLYTILSLAPLLVITIKVIGVIWRGKESAREMMMQQMTNLMGSQAAQAIGPMLDNGGKHGSGVLAATISTLLLVFSATGVFVELQDSMNTIWGVKPKPNQGIMGFVRNRLLSVGMVFGIAFLLLVSMFLSTVLSTMSRYIFGDWKILGLLLDTIVSFGVVTLLFASIFKFLPDVKLQWKHVWVGALMTGALFTVGKYGLAIYFKYAAPTSAFGAAGSLAAVLLWVYYSAFILFFGAEFTKVWAAHHGHQAKPEANAVKLTEDDRIHKGIPSRSRLQKAYKAASSNTASLPQSRNTQKFAALPPSAYALAAGLLVSGLVVQEMLERKR